MKQRPDMSGPASEITDPMHLFARVGYRIFLMRRDGEASPVDLYTGYVDAELKQLLKLDAGEE